MLRPADVVDLGEWLRAREFVVSAHQLVAATRLLSGPRVPQDTSQLADWLAPIFCTDVKEQDAFGGVYKEWHEQRWRTDVSTPKGTPQTALQAAARKAAAGFHVAVLPWVLATFLVLLIAAIVAAGLFWYRPHDLRIRVQGPAGMLDGARVAVDGGRVILQTDGKGEATHVVRRADLPIRLTVTHPTVHQGADLLAVSRTVEAMPSEPVVLELRPPPPPASAPAISTAHARWLRTLPAPDPLPGGDIVTTTRIPDVPRLVALAIGAVLPILWWAVAQLRRRGFLQRLPPDDLATDRWLRPDRAKPLDALLGELRSLGRDLRRRMLVPTSQLDLAATLRATVRRAGLVRLIFGTRIESEHLVLVDRASPGDHQARLAGEIVSALHAQNVVLEQYVFDRDPRACYYVPLDGTPAHAGPQSLPGLAGRHPQARVLIFSDGRGLIEASTGLPADWVAQFQAWDRVVLVTPQRREDWGTREWLLGQAGLTLLPLDSLGLQALSALLVEGRESAPVPSQARERHRPIYLRSVDRLLDSNFPGQPFVDQLTWALRRDLGEEGFSWLCGCAVYPEVHWGLTLAVGAAVAQAYDARAPAKPASAPELSTRLLADLARLPWLRHGYLPDWLRAAALERFPSRSELVVRDALGDFLDHLSPAGSAARADAMAVAIPDRRPVIGLWRDIVRGLRWPWGTGDPPPMAGQDRVFLKFMSAPRKLLALPVARSLLKLLYRDGVPLLGPTLIVPTVLVLSSIGVWQWMPPFIYQTKSEPAQLRLPRPAALAVDAGGRFIAVADDAGGLRRFATGGGAPMKARLADSNGAASSWSPSVMQPAAWAFLHDASAPLATSHAAAPADALCVAPGNVAGEGVPVLRASLRSALSGREPLACVVSSDGRKLVVLDDAGNVQLAALDEAPLRLKRIGEAGLGVSAMAVSDDGRMVALRQQGGAVLLLRGVDHAAEQLPVKGSTGLVALSGDGAMLAATDAAGRVDLWQLTPGKGRDVLLGISSGLGTTLPNVHLDVERIRDVLQARFGYAPIVLRDPTLSRLRSEFDAIRRDAVAEDRLIVIYSGVGQNGSWWLGRNLQSRADVLSGVELATMLRALPQRQILLINDTTQAGAALRQGRPDPVPDATRAVLASVDSSQQRAGNNEFSLAVYNALSTVTGPVSGEELGARVAQLRGNPSDETVTFGFWPAAGHDQGDIVLHPIAPPIPELTRALPVPGASSPRSNAQSATAAVGSWVFSRMIRSESADGGRAAWSPDGRWLAWTNPKGDPQVWDALVSPETTKRVVGSTGGKAIRFALGGRVLLIGQSEHVNAYLFLGDNLVPVGSIQPASGKSGSEIVDMLVHENDDMVTMLLANGYAETVRISLDAAEAKGEATAIIRSARMGTYPPQPSSGTFSRLAWEPSRKLLVASGFVNTKPLIRDGEGRTVRLAESMDLEDIAISPDGRLMAGDELMDVAVVDTRTLETVRKISLSDNAESIDSVAFSPDGSELAAGLYTGNIVVIDTATGVLKLPPLRGHPNGVDEIAFSPDGRLMATKAGDGLRIWTRSLSASPAKETPPSGARPGRAEPGGASITVN